MILRRPAPAPRRRGAAVAVHRRALAVPALVLAIVLMATSCKVAPMTWTQTPVPDPALPGRPVTTQFSNVSCGGPTSCLVVGQTDAVTTDGRVTTPTAPPPLISTHDLDCASPTWCMAVGQKFNEGEWTAVWDTGVWRAVPVPTGSFLSTVSCPARNTCVAIGGSGAASGATLPLALRFDGSMWTDITATGFAPDAAGHRQILAGVSCASTVACVAVGHTEAGGAMAWRWNGSTWATLPAPPSSGEPSAVSCPVDGECFAVVEGTNPSPRLIRIDRWHAGAWTEVHASTYEGGSRQIDCLSTTSCLVVSDTSRPGIFHAATTRLVGTTWTEGPDLANPYVVDLSCASATMCLAATHYVSDTIERFDGSDWAPVPPVVTGHGPSVASLYGVSCLSRTWCLAVGAALDGDSLRSMTARWDGVRWTLTTGGAAAPDDLSMVDVSCRTTTDCIAVGMHALGAGTPAVRRWNGTTWQDEDLTAALPGRPTGGLRRVSCLAAGFCLAIGDGGVTVRRDGSTWKPAPALGTDYASDLACSRPDHCIATHNVGLSTWDGSTWTMTSTYGPDHAAVNASTSVSCVAQGPCAVAILVDATHSSLLTEVTGPTGTVWTGHLLPASDEFRTYRVACSSATECIALGANLTSPANPGTLVWNGRTWTVGKPFGIATNNPDEGFVCLPGWCMHTSSLATDASGNTTETYRPAAEQLDVVGHD